MTAFLLSKVVPLVKDQLVTYRDIAKLLADLREKWRLACQEELEALHKCKVYKLTDLPQVIRRLKIAGYS